MFGRLLGIAAVACAGACAVTIETEEQQVRDDPELVDATCPPHSQLALAERFSDGRGAWPPAWLFSVTDGGNGIQSGGVLRAKPGATERATMEAPLDVASLRLAFSFESGASEEMVIGLFGSEARTAPPFDPAGFDVRISQDIEGEVAWAFHQDDLLAGLPEPESSARRYVLDARVTRRSRGARVSLSLGSEERTAPRSRAKVDVADLASVGPLAIAVANRSETHRSAALRVHEIVVCTATP